MKEVYTYLFDDYQSNTITSSNKQSSSQLKDSPNLKENQINILNTSKDISIQKTTPIKLQALNIESTNTLANETHLINKNNQSFQDQSLYNCYLSKTNDGCIIEHFNETNFIFILTLDLILLFCFFIIQIIIILLLFLFK